MEITKRIKTTPKNIDMLFDIGGNINLKFFEALDIPQWKALTDKEYENEKYTYKCVFRISDELKDEIKKARGFKGIWELIKKYDKDRIEKYVKEEIRKHEEEIKNLKQLLN